MRRFAPVVLAALLTGAVACGEKYLHTNPYDPAVPVAVDVVGPDTLFSYSEVGQYAGSSVPAFPDTAFVYASTDSASFTPVGYGKFASTAPPLYSCCHRNRACIGQHVDRRHARSVYGFAAAGGSVEHSE